jgi:hypothetical protein
VEDEGWRGMSPRVEPGVWSGVSEAEVWPSMFLHATISSLSSARRSRDCSIFAEDVPAIALSERQLTKHYHR